MPLDPTIAESAKQRSLRVPLNYLAERDSLARMKWLATLAIGGIAAVYVGWLLIGSRAGNSHLSPGRVAAVHGAWNDECSACHVSFRPLRSDAVDLISLVRGADPVAQRTLRDEACLKCHHVPGHHASERASDVATCAACHREHGGTAFNIRRPADSQCASCHAAIEQHRDGPSDLTPQTGNVTGFAAGESGQAATHPAFRSLTSDPGNIKFNHWLHLQPGMAVGDAKHKQRLDSLPSERQAAYARLSRADGLLQLDCSACHQPGERGDLMRPIAYEQHCRACHPLGMELAEYESGRVEVPHGLPAERLEKVLDGMLVATQRRVLSAAEPITDESGDLPLIPGKTLGRNLAQKLGQDLLVKRATLNAAVAARCEQCHEWEVSPGDSPASGLREVRRANIPKQWLAHARFDHAGHRHVECRTCHAGAYAFEQRDQPRVLLGAELPPRFARARDNEEVMIAGIETCVTCHAPRRRTLGGARHDCAECHAYHGSERERVADVQRHGVSAVPSAGRDVGDSSPGPLDSHVVNQLGPDDPGYFLTALRASLVNGNSSAPEFVGIAACGASGCHGGIRDDGSHWQSAFSTWLVCDPHAQARDVLWTFRGREMTRLLSGLGAATEQGHRQVIEQRCIGCHATPTAGQASEHRLGVQCESCHGSAQGWLHTHYRAGFDRAAARGFVDTKSLDARAAACMPCHVGPNESTGEPQVVDHDLIAAGHPRLNFEFHAYQASLPAHWDREKDERQQGPDFHYRAWLAGQTQQAASLESLANMAQKPTVDFALLNCASCHHALGTSDWWQQSAFTGLQATASPRLPNLPASGLAARVAWARGLFLEPNISHDDAVRRYLALRPVMDDLKPNMPKAAEHVAAVNERLNELGRYLAADCFGQQFMSARRPTQYELPAAFDPAEFAKRARPLLTALAELETSLLEAGREP